MAESSDDSDQGADDLPAEEIGHFHIHRRLGRGAAGDVFLAEDTRVRGRLVALKLLRADGIAGDLAAHEAEARALSSVNHPNILVFHESGNCPIGPYLVTEYLDGGSLKDRLRDGPLPQADALRHARDAADALDAAHKRSITHRDVKPANFLFTADGRVKVADFGLAVRVAEQSPLHPDTRQTTVTVSGQLPAALAGTPGYLAPEALTGGTVGAKQDQFAFGMTLHQMLTGEHPQEGVPWPRVIAGEAQLSSSLDGDLRRIVERCVSPDPAVRYAGMGAIRDALALAIRKRDPRRRRLVKFAGVAVSLVLLLALAWAGNRWNRTRQAVRLVEQGLAAWSAGERLEARGLFFRARGKDTSYMPACNNLGMAALEEADRSWAMTVLRECERDFPETPEVLYNLGAVLAREGELDAAASRLEAAMAAGPGPEAQPRIANELALIKSELGRPEQALQLVQRTLEASARPESIAVLRKTEALLLLELDRPTEAAVAFRRALDGPLENDTRAAALVGLGRSLEATGDTEGAFRAYNEALFEDLKPDTRTQAVDGLARLQGD